MKTRLRAFGCVAPLLLFSLAVAGPTPTRAAEPEKKGIVIPPETIGNWGWKDASRPIKAMAIGGSVTAWPRGPYTAFLHAACPNVEIVNKGKVGIGALKLKERFSKQLIRNRRINLKKHETYLLFQGGLNSLGLPYRTNRDVLKIFNMARKHGVKVVALSLMSWGNGKSWKEAKGLGKHWKTNLAVDFVTGKLTPEQALGKWRKGRANPDAWEAGELPAVSINMYESPLRDKDAPLRADTKRLRRMVQTDAFVRKQLKGLEADAKAAALEKWVQTARELPRWFMKRDLRAFDSIHPNTEGHRVMAMHVCPNLPASWGCKCDAIPAMKWSRKRGQGIIPKVKKAASAP